MFILIGTTDLSAGQVCLAAYPEGYGYLRFAQGKLSREGIHVLYPVIASPEQRDEAIASCIHKVIFNTF